jgi:hypothetical protein
MALRPEKCEKLTIVTLVVYSLGWEVSFKDLEPADLNGRICVIGFLLVAGQKPVMDALYTDATEVGCSRCVDKVLVDLINELVAPSCTGLAKVRWDTDWLHCEQIYVVAPYRRS